ncbi:MAG: insulinase family protein [Prevotella sp.]|nr:insulinase family protein [Prevotella sp.]
MKLRKLALSLVALLSAGVMSAQEKIAPDAAYRIGKLDNGLTYYIRHNNYPEHLANFYIAQRVGSIQENDDQRGLAHFLEHMAFNGSTHFDGNGIIDYCRTLGVAFGSDINAYTSIEQTVYNIDNVPVARQSALDSCLLILSDWSNGLLLKAEEIDKERGVIHGEWAMRNNAQQRIMERNLPKYYPGCKYGERLPIGTMEIVDNFKPEALRAYYEKWYHPENQAIIVVGDVDVDKIEATIKKLFSGIKAGPNAAHVEPVMVPDNEQPIFIFDHDKEITNTSFSIMMKKEPMAKNLVGTKEEYIRSYKLSFLSGMFRNRVSELSQNPESPFHGLSIRYGEYMVSSTKDAFSMSAVSKEGKDKETLLTLFREVKRVRDFGFNETEFNRVKTNMLSSLEASYAARDKRSNSSFYNECLANYLDGVAIPDIDFENKLCKEIINSLTVADINALAKEIINLDEDRNLVFMITQQEKEGETIYTEESMKQLLAEARKVEVEKWSDDAVDRPLLAKLPKAGKIKKEKDVEFGFRELTLSNGIKVYIQKTDHNPNSVSLTGWAPGGANQYDDSERINVSNIGTAISCSGVGGFKGTELSKVLTGKHASAGISIGGRYHNASGSCIPKDMETMFQLLYLHFQPLTKDENIWNINMESMCENIKKRGMQPETAFSDTITAEKSNHNPITKPLTEEELRSASYDRCLEMVNEFFSTACGFQFIVIGDYDEAELRKYLCQYIASLPTKGKMKPTTDKRIFFYGDKKNEFWREMQAPKPMIYDYYYSKGEYSLKNSILCSIASQTLGMALLKAVREDAGATYSIGARISMSSEPELTTVGMTVQAPISEPAKVDLALNLVSEVIEKFANNKADEYLEGTLADAVTKVKANMLKQYEMSLKQNGHWSSALQTLKLRNIDTHTDFKATVESITAEQVAAYVRDVVLKDKNHLRVIMRVKE